MRLLYHPRDLYTLCILLPAFTTAITPGCDQVVTDKKHFDLGPLGGAHSVFWSQPHSPGVLNTTYTIDICKPLIKPKGGKQDETCSSGTYVCGIERKYGPDTNGTIMGVRPIAAEGRATSSGAGNLSPRWTLMSKSPSNSDAEKEGVRLEMGGGIYSGKKHKVIVELLCLREEERVRRELLRERQEEDSGGDDGEPQEIKGAVDDGKGGTLKFVSFTEAEEGTLRLQWDTKYACEDARDKENSGNGHWGFFTWLIIIVFLGIAAYLIFGSWLNYNRYGARGWDLLPHGDTIRDIPYLFRDWMRRVVDTVQGGGSRGGYSAV